jgi:hypothetical protein
VVFLNAALQTSAGVTAGPLTIEAQNVNNLPVTFQTNVTVNLSSDSTGDYLFFPTPGAAPITSLVIPPTTSDGVFYYTAYRAGNTTINALALAAIPTPSANLSDAVSTGPYSMIQVLVPDQAPDAGKPITDPSGRTGLPDAVFAGNSVPVTFNAVDKYFNIINTSDSVTLGTSVTLNQGPFPITNGTGTASLIFIKSGPQTAYAAGSSGETGHSDPIPIMAGTSSTKLNVVHASPALSTVLLGQTGVRVFDFILTVQNGTDAISVQSVTFHGQDESGAAVPMNSAFSKLSLINPAGVGVTYTEIPGVSSSVSFTQPLLVNSQTPLTLYLAADISASASAKTVQLLLGGTDVVSQDASNGALCTNDSFGDPTGFPMKSSVILIGTGDVASSYGNYPNPFHPETGNTTIEFNLSSPQSYSLMIFDILGKKVRAFESNGPQSGLQQLSWDGKNDAGAYVLSGVYYGQLNVNGSKYLTKIAVVK